MKCKRLIYLRGVVEVASLADTLLARHRRNLVEERFRDCAIDKADKADNGVFVIQESNKKLQRFDVTLASFSVLFLK